MTTILTSAPGVVTRLNTGRLAIPFRIDLPNFPSDGAIVTHAQMEQAGNYQFLHTVQDFIYVYIFGDRIGTLTVSGVAFLAKCSGAGVGIEEVIQYYNNNRLAIAGGPVRVGFGSIPFEAFLTAASFNVRDTGLNGSLGFFTFQFHTFPDERAQPQQLLDEAATVPAIAPTSPANPLATGATPTLAGAGEAGIVNPGGVGTIVIT